MVGRKRALTGIADRLLQEHERGNLRFGFASRASAALEEVATRSYDLCILDSTVGDDEARKLLRGTRVRKPPVPVLVLARSSRDGAAVRALQEGARDYLLWPETDTATLFRTLRILLRAERVERDREHWRRRYHRLFSSCLAPAFRLRIDGRIEDCNDLVVRMLGYESADELLGKAHLEPYPGRGDTGVGVAEPDSGWLFDVANGVPQQVTLRRKDGSPLRVEICCQLLEQTPGVPPAFEGTFRGLDEESEPLSGEQRRPLESWAARHEGLVLIRADGAVEGWNREAARILGLPRNHGATGGEPLPLDRLVDAEGKQLNWRSSLVRRALKRGEPLTGVTLGVKRSKQGETRWISISTTPLFAGADTKPWAVLASLTDMAAARRLEQQMLQAQKMEVMGHLLGSVAHDFKNMLTAIQGYSQLLLAGLDEDDPRRKSAQEVSDACRRASALTGQLLAFSRRQEPKTELVEIAHVTANLKSLLERLVGKHGELEIKLSAPGAVRADPVRLEQLIMNLVVNARDALDNGGRILVGACNVDIRDPRATAFHPDPGGDWIMLTVSDTGVGMDRETQQHVFEPFFTTKESGKGTGLGLTTVHRIVDAAGGRVRVESESGKGTTVRVFLPRVKG